MILENKTKKTLLDYLNLVESIMFKIVTSSSNQ